MKALINFLIILILTGFIISCGGGGGGTPADDTTNPADDTPQIQPPKTHTIAWLQQGTTWKYQWSIADLNQSWTDVRGDYDEGFFIVTLGVEQPVNDLLVYPLIKSGDDGGFLSQWNFIGADGNNDIYGLQSLASNPVRLYAASNENPSNGYFQSFTSSISVIPNKLPASQSFYAGEYPSYNMTLTAIGSSGTDYDFSSGGCEYFSGYGTICTEASSGPITGLTEFQYWSADKGPTVMHYYKSYEDCLGTACTKKKLEKRIDLFSFSSTATLPDDLLIEKEPNNYSTPTNFPINKAITSMVANISNTDPASGYINGYSAPVGMDLAATMQDWYEFEILPGEENVTFDFYLVWNDTDVLLDFFIYTSPENSVYGFLYLGEGNSFTMESFNHSKFLSGTYLPGKYLLGVKSSTTLSVPIGYGIIAARSDLL